MSTIYLNIGSNKGHRHSQIERAVALLASVFGHERLRCSRYIESEAWGYASENVYLNIGVAIEIEAAVTADDALTMLDVFQSIEREIDNSPHRHADGSYRDRGIDIDIIAIDYLTVDTPRLTLPHPRAALRRFVMEPLAELAPVALVEWIASAQHAAHDLQ